MGEYIDLNEHIETLEGALADAQDGSFDRYQMWTADTAIYPDNSTMEALQYLGLKLTSEAGEVAGKIGKILRDQHGSLTADNREDLASELGDVLWYVARLAATLGYPLSEIAENNRRKLIDRASRGVIGGSGDHR